MSFWSNMDFQNFSTHNMMMLDFFHTVLISLLVFILIGVLMFQIYVFFMKFYTSTNLENHSLEFSWTILPCFILVGLSVPSLALLYKVEESVMPEVCVNSTGNQWYWSYSYSDLENVEYESFMVPADSMTSGMFRLLDVDNKMVVPINVNTRISTTSNDVLHCMAVPSMGLKMDSVPGRLNSSIFNILIPGLYYGQCSEICGANHSFMPVVVECTSTFNFLNWLNLF